LKCESTVTKNQSRSGKSPSTSRHHDRACRTVAGVAVMSINIEEHASDVNE